MLSSIWAPRLSPQQLRDLAADGPHRLQGQAHAKNPMRLLRPIARLQKAARRVRETRPDVEHYGLRQTASCYG